MKVLHSLVPFAVVAGLVVLITIWAMWLVVIADRAACHGKAAAMNVNWSWGAAQGCMIVVDGKTIPIEAYKVFKVAP